VQDFLQRYSFAVASAITFRRQLPQWSGIMRVMQHPPQGDIRDGGRQAPASSQRDSRPAIDVGDRSPEGLSEPEGLAVRAPTRANLVNRFNGAGLPSTLA
jgi:hypothetical protein